MLRPAWLAVAAAAMIHVGLSHLAAERAHAPVTYVFTPLVDVVPGGVPLTAGEAAELSAEAKNRVDARDIQQAYARMGSTISLDDLLRGVEGLEGGAHALDEAQRAQIRGVLERAATDHAAVLAVQSEILDLEAALARDVETVLAGLPEEARARVLARGSKGGKAASGGGPRGGPPSSGPSGGPPGGPGGGPPGAPSSGVGSPAGAGPAPLPSAPAQGGAR